MLGKITKLLNKFLQKEDKKQPGEFFLERADFLKVLFYLMFALVFSRAIYIHLFTSYSTKLHNIAENQYLKQIELAPYRGSILDKKYEPFAISIRLPSIAVNPRVFNPTQHEIYKLSKLLRLPQSAIISANEKQSYFSWLKRRVSHSTGEAIQNMKIEGVSIISEPSRFYPSGSVAAHLIGYVGADDNGLAGLEKQFDTILKSPSKKININKDGRGNQIFFNSHEAIPETGGHNIVLTIDKAIQEIVEEELIEGVKAASAKSGFAIVSDPHTGKILAMANYPDFNPNERNSKEIKNSRNKALLDIFEPGSVVKPIVVAAALEQHLFNENDVLNCENGSYRIGKNIIHDTHPASTLSVTDVIVESSNICTYKIAEKLGKQRLFESLTKFGFGMKISAIEFPGVMFGRLDFWKNWRPIRFANIAFGQGFTVTGIELIQAFNAIANGGNLYEPYIVEKTISADNITQQANSSKIISQVLAPETAKTMREILAKVVTHGSGKKAATKDYTTAGKTGTTEKVDPITRAYSDNLRLASFIGFAPVEDPHVVIYVVIDEPGKKPYYGGVWAAPVFSNITQRTLKYLNVAPSVKNLDDKEKVGAISIAPLSGPKKL